ncbi:hypothetical protein CL622_04080 [archaeon]|nr:hypothetical protein [archaeon]|tara:strand:+ start:546 stop:749 length:204 start_codon:yes stop_codon:yes gene_type:complete
MKLLITQTEYQAHSTFPNITANHSQEDINSTTCVYCDVTDEQAFNQLSLDSDAYATGDGILLPKEAL